MLPALTAIQGSVRSEDSSLVCVAKSLIKCQDLPAPNLLTVENRAIRRSMEPQPSAWCFCFASMSEKIAPRAHRHGCLPKISVIGSDHHACSGSLIIFSNCSSLILESLCISAGN